MTIKSCHYEDRAGNCWYKGHEGHKCDYVHREWGCPIARHEQANENLIRKYNHDHKKPELPHHKPVVPRFLRKGTLMK